MTTFNFTSGDPNNLVAAGSASMGDIQGPFVDLRTFLNGRSLNADNLAVALLQQLGVNDTSGQKGRGPSIIPTTGTRTNTAYGQLSDGPDQVSGIVLPTNGLIAVAYQATWQESVDNAARAAIFIGANQLKIGATNVAAPVVQDAANDMTINTDAVLATGPGGLQGFGAAFAAAAYGGDVTTGQVIGNAMYQANQTGGGPGGSPMGGPVYIFAAAGTYTVSVQFKASSGTVTAKNRKLWVWTVGF